MYREVIAPMKKQNIILLKNLLYTELYIRKHTARAQVK